MKLNPIGLILMLLFMGAANLHAQNPTDRENKPLRHIVLFAFKEGTSAKEIAKIHNAFKALPAKIPQIKSFEWGLNNSPEGLNKGLTHCYTLTFDTKEDRAIYLPHPDHKAFGAILSPYLADVLVVDYWATQL